MVAQLAQSESNIIITTEFSVRLSSAHCSQVSSHADDRPLIAARRVLT